MLNKYIKENITPQEDEKSRIAQLNEIFNQVLGEEETFMSGSCARHTHVSPPKDLDIIYVLNEGDEAKNVVNQTATFLRTEIPKYTKEPFEISEIKDTAIEVVFKNDNFSVDIVPSYKLDEQLEGNYLYEVYVKRTGEFQKSDPKGYRDLIKNMNDSNPNFRPAVRLIKKWKDNAKANFPEGVVFLKSFHIENIFVEIFKENPSIDIENAVVIFLQNSWYLDSPHFPDRANNERFIDAYLDDLVTTEMKDRMKKIFSDNLIIWQRVCASTEQSDFDKWIELFMSGIYMTKEVQMEVKPFIPPQQHAV